MRLFEKKYSKFKLYLHNQYGLCRFKCGFKFIMTLII